MQPSRPSCIHISPESVPFHPTALLLGNLWSRKQDWEVESVPQKLRSPSGTQIYAVFIQQIHWAGKFKAPTLCQAVNKTQCPLLSCRFISKIWHGIYFLITALANSQKKISFLVLKQSTLFLERLLWRTQFGNFQAICGHRTFCMHRPL